MTTFNFCPALLPKTFFYGSQFACVTIFFYQIRPLSLPYRYSSSDHSNKIWIRRLLYWHLESLSITKLENIFSFFLVLSTDSYLLLEIPAIINYILSHVQLNMVNNLSFLLIKHINRLLFSLSSSFFTHTHTHTHVYIYIYIYIYTPRLDIS